MLNKLVASTVRRVLHTRGYRVAPLDDADPLEPLLYTLLRQRGSLSLVQIGANDGQFADPVYRFVMTNHRRLRVLVVEPLPDLFARLQATYRHCPTVTPVRCAIHNTARTMTMYRVDPKAGSRLPKWTQGIASFDHAHHRRSNIPADYILAEEVLCLSLTHLVNAHGFEQVDVLQIDAEGYDAEIVRGIDFARVRPTIIHFEHGLPHGTMSASTFADVRQHLHAQGYELAMSQYDATAYLPNLFLPQETRSA